MLRTSHWRRSWQQKVAEQCNAHPHAMKNIQDLRIDGSGTRAFAAGVEIPNKAEDRKSEEYSAVAHAKQLRDFASERIEAADLLDSCRRLRGGRGQRIPLDARHHGGEAVRALGREMVVQT